MLSRILLFFAIFSIIISVVHAQSGQCSDGIDNDGDGSIDALDFSCSRGGAEENSFLAECQDGKDNDQDSLTDLGDFGCRDKQDNEENSPASPGTIPNYYVCDCGAGADANCVSGSDNNSGTTAASAYKTYDKIQDKFSTLTANQTIAFCRGGSFTVVGQTRWLNNNCLRNLPCTIRDYTPLWASGDERDPLIVSTGGGVFDLTDGSGSAHQEGQYFLNLNLTGVTAGTAVLLGKDIDDVTLSNLTINNFAIGVQVSPVQSASEASDRLVLQYSRILNNVQQGFLGSGNYYIIQNNTFDNNAVGTSIFGHNLYYSAAGGATLNSRISGNDLYRNSIFGGVCSSTSLTIHGNHTGLKIEDNYVHEDIGKAGQGCYGISIAPGGATYPELVDKGIIRRNRIVNTGRIAIECTGCVNTSIEDNIIIFGQNFGGSIISVPSRVAQSPDPPSSDVRIRNNVLFVNSDNALTAIYVSLEGSKFKISSNVIHYTGTQSGFNCFGLDLPSSSYDAIDYNLCYAPNSPSAEWEDGSGSLANWQAASPWDDYSLTSNPLFVNPGVDFTPQSTSPMISAGDPTLSSIRDYLDRLRDNQPDMGAIEYFSSSGSCGDGQCSGSETFVSCPADCPSHLVCQNNTCTRISGVGSDSCSIEDSACGQYCGNGICDGSETCNSCSDCACSTGLTCYNSVCIDCDADDDSYSGVQCAGNDCNDMNSAINIAANDVCEDGIDQDCDGSDSVCSSNPPPASGGGGGSGGSTSSSVCSSGQTQACGLVLGECVQGVQMCVSGVWGVCTGAVLPLAELCDNKDNDCDGLIDDLVCSCTTGDVRSCGSNIGECEEGTSVCDNQRNWGACVGAVVPLDSDICGNGLDDNCNGLADENCIEAESTCKNGMQDAGETGIDCGGQCAKACKSDETPLTGVIAIVVVISFFLIVFHFFKI